MVFEDTWGSGLIKITLTTNTLPYRLTERYGSAVRTRRFWSRLVAEVEHSTALDNARHLIHAIRDAQPQHRTGSFLRAD